ncbi:MAG: hypothetical protein ACK5JU_04600 [Bacteroidales bacterium]
MTSEEKIKQMVGKREPFKVPEGYFEQLTQNIMEQIPEERPATRSVVRVTMFERVKPLLYLAACFGGLMLGLGYFIGQRNIDPNAAVEPIEVFASDNHHEDEMENTLYMSSANEFLLYEALYAQNNN